MGAASPMLVDLVPEFLAAVAAPDPVAAYYEYLGRHRTVLSAYWQNYVLDPESAAARRVVAETVRADRSDLRRLLEDVDVHTIAEDALRRSLDAVEADCPVDLYITVGVGAANAGELVVAGRVISGRDPCEEPLGRGQVSAARHCREIRGRLVDARYRDGR